MSQPRPSMPCEAVDELDAAFALGAVDAAERRAIVEHVDSCSEPHARLRAMLGAGPALAASLEPVEPRPELRRRLMTAIGATPQEHRGAVPEPESGGPAGRGWLGWLSPGWARGLAAAGVVGVVLLGGVSIGLWGQLSSRDQELRTTAQVLDGLVATISAGEAAYRVDGSAGRGFVVESPEEGESTLVITNVAGLSGDQLYELWLIAGDGAPVAVGTFTPPSGNVLAIVNVEEDLDGYDTFAVTVEASRVDAPTSDPVMVAALGG